MSEKKRLFVDMDGTLAEFKVVDTLERLYEPHYFERLKPNERVVKAISDINRNHPEIEVYILSAVLTDSKYALYEKKNWIKEYLPEIPEDRCIFPPCGSDKKDFIPDGIRSDDFLLDDYSLNLNSWEPPARGIKLLNGINGNNGTWDKDSISYIGSSEKIAENICAIINDNVRIIERKPQVLNELYDDFLYHSGIFNSEHIAFTDKYGELPSALNTAENRIVVSEYINMQLDGGNITEAQRGQLEALQQAIRETEEPLFKRKVDSITEWVDGVFDKAAERKEIDNTEQEKENRDKNER